MDILGLAAISGAVLLGTTGLLVWHVRHWRGAQRENLDPGELQYRRGQLRRRMQTTALLGLATAALPFGLPIIRIWPKAGTGYVIIVLLLYLWAGILALTDMWAIKFFFGRLSDENRLEQLRLEAELRRRRRDPRRNGRDPPPGQPQDRPAPGPKPEGEP